MPIKCVISVPSKMITGVFNIRFALARRIENLDASNIGIKTLVGDAVGSECEIRGKGRNWYSVHRIPDNCVGRSEISLIGSINGTSETFDADTAIIQYDTRRMVRCVMTAPRKTVIGKSNIRLTFARDIQGLDLSNVKIETVSGDAIGDNIRVWGKEGNWYVTCKIPDNCIGRSEVSLTGSVIANGGLETIDARTVRIAYDTVKVVNASFGTPIKRGRKIEIPVSLDTPIQHLKKLNFRFSPATPFQLYGTGDSYSLVLPDKRKQLKVSVFGPVQKTNGIDVKIIENVLEVNRGALN